MKQITLILLLLACGFITLFGKDETWTSSVGSKILGRYLGTSESKHFIIGQDSGRLFKLSDSQLSADSLKRIKEIQEKKELRESRGEKLSRLLPQVVDSETEGVVVALGSVKVPNISFESVSVESALRTIADRIEPELNFEFTDESLKSRVVSIQLRNLYADQIMDYALHQVGLCYQVSGNTVTIKPNRG